PSFPTRRSSDLLQLCRQLLQHSPVHIHAGVLFWVQPGRALLLQIHTASSQELALHRVHRAATPNLMSVGAPAGASFTFDSGNSMSAIPLTAGGAERLQAELHRLKTVERPEVINAIAEA